MNPEEIFIRRFTPKDVPEMRSIWNEVVRSADAFPQETEMQSDDEALCFFNSQTHTAVAESDGKVLGLYILHPNNIGRCATIANASYAVKKDARGKGIGKRLVENSLEKAREAGFHVLQFNAVLKSNVGAIRLYEKLGFQSLGEIPGCYRKDDGTFENLRLFFYKL